MSASQEASVLNSPHASPPAVRTRAIRRPQPPEPRIVPIRRPARWLAAGVVLLAFLAVVNSLARNPAFQWDVVWRYFTAPAVLNGLYLTLWLTAVTMVLGFGLGTVLAVMRVSQNPVLQGLSWGYVWIFRSTPLLVQLLFWFNIGALYPRLSLGVPFGPELVSVNTVNLIGATAAAVIGLTLHEAAYAAEIVRGGLLSVDSGQIEAAHALGLSKGRILRRIILPQAMRAIIPPAGNLLIGTLKGTSIVSVIAVQDLLYSVQLIYNRNYLVIPLLLVATIWYVLVTSVLTVGQYYVERYYARGSARQLPPTPPQRFRAWARTWYLRLRRHTVEGRA
ncbi:amino acid ABC transporter permease [Carbonactinospora thermoautotrophica]|uniref:Polar amino acid ABC transporter n=1 Tax=Carbonactinospora thermoautotrophica TaxID=1469144 RepID=A0A132MWL5_9ACTN|nr:amino acid ABC transporter permease [Carbonactinospora thermoautotrophica]KWX02136.1 Polar amino acid ABC transporter [Carbonactinospora thermoautotrophica]MCX9190046.1 amino acid ABC transporter permease [Carbonactinospora thermoautotrophica]